MTWLIWYLSSCIICNSKSLRIKKKNKSELWNHLSYRGPSYLFEFGSQTNFQKWLQISEVVAFDLKGKIASNQYKPSKYWWEVWIFGGGCKIIPMSSVVREEWLALPKWWLKCFSVAIVESFYSVKYGSSNITSVILSNNLFGFMSFQMFVLNNLKYWHLLYYFDFNLKKIV